MDGLVQERSTVITVIHCDTQFGPAGGALTLTAVLSLFRASTADLLDFIFTPATVRFNTVVLRNMFSLFESVKRSKNENALVRHFVAVKFSFFQF